MYIMMKLICLILIGHKNRLTVTECFDCYSGQKREYEVDSRPVRRKKTCFYGFFKFSNCRYFYFYKPIVVFFLIINY